MSFFKLCPRLERHCIIKIPSCPECNRNHPEQGKLQGFACSALQWRLATSVNNQRKRLSVAQEHYGAFLWSHFLFGLVQLLHNVPLIVPDGKQTLATTTRQQVAGRSQRANQGRCEARITEVMCRVTLHSSRFIFMRICCFLCYMTIKLNIWVLDFLLDKTTSHRLI